MTERATFRLFVALDLSDHMRGELVAWGARALGDLPGTRLQRPEAMHVTLCFLGGQPAGEVEAIADATRAAVGSHAELTLALGAPVWLPPRRPRVVAVALIDPSGALAALQADLAAALGAGGWYEAERRFLAHVTVARVGRGGGGGRGGRIGGARGREAGPRWPPDLPPPPAASVTARSVSLYRSHTAASGPRYEPLTTIQLASP